MNPFDISPDIATSPQVMEIAEKMKKHRYHVAGLVVAFHGWCYHHARGCETGLSCKSLNALFGTRGFAEAMISAGVLTEGEDKKLLINQYDDVETSCEGAPTAAEAGKKKPLTRAEIQRNHRKRKREEREGEVTDEVTRVTSGVTNAVTEAVTEAVTSEVTRYVTPPPIIYKNNVEGSDTVVLSEAEAMDGSGAVTAPPCQIKKLTYKQFLQKIGGVNPASAKMRLMPKDAELASKTAYETWDLGEEEAELLAAFYKADFSNLPQGTKFWRPRGLLRFYEELGDVLSHAQEWAKWKGWKPKSARQTREVRELKPVEPDEQSAEDYADMMAFWDEQKSSLSPSINTSTPTISTTSTIEESCPTTTTLDTSSTT